MPLDLHSNGADVSHFVLIFFPDDYNRVVLEAYDGECDYINASYVDVSRTIKN